MLQLCYDDEKYDIILISDNEIIYNNLGNIKIRYLNYINYDYIEITLNHPKCLVSASLSEVKIANLNKCTNLQNLYSIFNTYSQQDISTLKNLKRFSSYGDKYENE